MSELGSGTISVQELLNSLTLLPFELLQEYDEKIVKKLPDLLGEKEVSYIFIHLNPLVSFLDYGLIKYIIDQFGSDLLKKKMDEYHKDVIVFMKNTTVKQLMDHWSGPQKVSQNYYVLKAKINKDPKTYTLYELDQLRKQYCSELKMATLYFKIIGLKMANSFIVEWLVPSALVPQLVASSRKLDSGFYLHACIQTVMVGEINIFPFSQDSNPKVPALQDANYGNFTYLLYYS